MSYTIPSTALERGDHFRFRNGRKVYWVVDYDRRTNLCHYRDKHTGKDFKKYMNYSFKVIVNAT